MSASVTDRYHALDSLRGFAMFLGVVLHAGISFMVNPPPFWPVRDDNPTPVADLFLLAVHDFRMQVFFLLAGFFCCLLYQRYGVAGMAGRRAKRVVVPLVLALLFIVPTVFAAVLYAEIENVRAGVVRGEPSPLRPIAAELVAANPDASTGRLVLNYFLAMNPGIGMPPGHLWFLYYLLYFYVAVALLAPALGRLTGTRLLAHTDSAFRRLIESRYRVIVPGLLTFPLMLPMWWIVDTPSSWRPQWHIMAYYFWFFAFGWMLFRHRDLVPAFGRGWRLNLLVANGLMLPAMLGLIITGATAEREGAPIRGAELAAFAVQVVYTWLMIAGLWGAFLHYFSRERAWVRYLADASYWCYLASITPIVVFQFWVRDWPLPGLVKFGFVTVLTMAVLLASYEWCVRYTFIGAILNGRKYRPQPVERPVATSTPA